MIRVGNLSTPLLFSALPPVNIHEASPKAISGRTSYIRVRLEFLRYPQVIRQLFNGGRFGPPLTFTSTSTCSWIGHPVSGLIHATLRSLQTRFHFGSEPEVLNLAAYINSPDRSTKSTTSHLYRALCACKHKVSGSFHSPPGVLFTFPSQYFSTIGHRVVFRLGGWSPHLPGGFLVSAGTRVCRACLQISPTGLSPPPVSLPRLFGYLTSIAYRQASSAFARRYLRNLG